MMKRALAALAATTSLALAPAAFAADWFRAETEHFIVYAEDDQDDTVEFAQDLERLDEVLSLFTGVKTDAEPLPESSKVTVFRFGETSDMSVLLAGNRNTGVGGFFIGRANGSVAFVPRQRNKRRDRSLRNAIDEDMMLDPKATLFHEYVHYFMFQHADAPYPLWYSEGFAELFSNLEFNEDDFVIGDVPTWRSASLTTIPIDLEKTFDPPARGDRTTVGRTYAHGWLIASHLNLNPERRGQMSEYMVAIGEGLSPMEAAERAFGDLDVLHDELEEFRRGAARTLRVPYAVNAEPEVEVRKLNEAQAARMETMIKSKRGVDEDRAERVVREARKLVAQYPQSPEVLLTATEAEFDARNYNEAERLASQLLALDPQSTEAANFYAAVALRRSFEDPSQLAEARSRFAAANKLETDHAFPLYGYYLTYLFDESQPIPDQAKIALEAAFSYAPFDINVRQALIHMLLKEDRANEARIVGASFLNDNSGYSCMLRKKFDEYSAGDKEPLLEEVRPDHPGDYMDEAAQEARQKETEAEIEKYGCETD
ncbi:tetratricopeptide repeat protein [Aurantiacibacter rhizosphaerae]|uniref:DUF1570 domain-containing protein n=1 Tax=Aurantiacibacter rhizosphaerae TaxID=2691582 RepID=A0A844XHY8_9SPHN|nr:tetratricopeptide repeat protein [Aurantiacibacter rhizosphaerae]MWV29440.1 hypothetical protein [Aurantiacibacter rhizosphaerae]